MMKKMMTCMLTIFVAASLSACAGTDKKETELTSATVSVENASEENSSEIKRDTEAGAESVETESSEKAESETSGNHVLVAYFSATGTTRGVAEQIADGLNAELYEIIPEEPYTEADLNYNDNHSRSTIEMNDPSARPAIDGSVDHMEQYDVVFLGYPIWWGEAPRIMDTFVENYDFSGKTVVPFFTSGGSGVGSSAANLEKLTSGATWLEGHRMNGKDSQERVMEWVNSLGLNLNIE